jgi:LysR family transcriptional regulator for metE and metH
MPALDGFRAQWPEVELDLSAGFNFAPLPALVRGDLDMVITSDPVTDPALSYVPLFRYELVLALGNDHPLTGKNRVQAEDLATQTLLAYPVARERLDIFTAFLEPAGVEPASLRTTELTPLMVQLVASGRGVAALPNWALTEYMQAGLVSCRSLGKGVWRTLYAAVRREERQLPYLQQFMEIAREHCFRDLRGIREVSADGPQGD